MNHQISKIEKYYFRHNSPNGIIFAFGNIPDVHPSVLSLVMCSFHWYSVSACNYVWLVGWLLQQNKISLEAPKAYAERVIPKVVLYRNKIAAHLSFVFPRNDNKADRLDALMPLSIANNCFYAGSTKSSFKSHGILEFSKHNYQWSLTKTHIELAKRYWPEQLANTQVHHD